MSDRNIKQQAPMKMLGRYEIRQRLGRGGMGDVWLCEDPRLHRQVAIKTLPIHNQQDEEFVARFEHEARAAAALNHPHILSVHDYGKQPLSDGSLITYIVMPYIRGGSLATRIASYAQKKTLMLIPEALTFLSQAAEAIDYAHEQHVIHRDIKPGNMLLRDDDWLMLADFGIARMLTTADRLTATGPGFGTAEYMAPEQAHGQAVISSDIYSLAVIAYQLFTGRLPFQADTSYAITIQHLTMPPPPPRQINPALSATFEQVLLQGLAKQPAERPTSAMAFVEALQNAHVAASSETTYRKVAISQTASTFIKPDGNQSITEQETVLTDHKGQDNAKPLLTRRRLLLGGSAAAVLALGGGLEVWKLTSTSQQHIAPRPKATVKITKNPDAPAFVLTGYNYQAETLAWHPQKHFLVSASAQDYWMITWNIDTLLKQQNKSPHYTQLEYIKIGNSTPFVVWSPDGKYLAIVNNESGSPSSKVSIDLYTIDPKTLLLPRNPSLSIALPTNNIISGLAWLQNRYLITVENNVIIIGNQSYNQLLMRISDITQPKTQWKPAVFKNTYLSSDINTNHLAISPDNLTVAINSNDGILVGKVNRVGNTAEWQALISPLQSLSDVGPDSLGGVAWSSDGNKIISADTFKVAFIPTFWNWREKNPQTQQLSVSNPSNSVVLSALVSNPASTTPCFATGSKNGEVALWNAVAGALPIKTLDNGGISGPVSAMAWSQDGHWLAASFGDINASILIWKL